MPLAMACGIKFFLSVPKLAPVSLPRSPHVKWRARSPPASKNTHLLISDCSKIVKHWRQSMRSHVFSNDSPAILEKSPKDPPHSRLHNVYAGFRDHSSCRMSCWTSLALYRFAAKAQRPGPSSSSPDNQQISGKVTKMSWNVMRSKLWAFVIEKKKLAVMPCPSWMG